MTEPTPNTTADTATAPKADTRAEPALLSTQKKTRQDKQPPQKKREPSSFGRAAINAALTAAVVGAIALAVATWVLAPNESQLLKTMQQRIDEAQQQTARTTETQIQAQTQALQTQIQTLQTQLADTRKQNQQLEAVQQTLRGQVRGLEQALQLYTANGGQAVLLHAVEQLVDMAQQQLTLAGNVNQAIIALETAQARLARASFPALAPLQQAINGDLERLRTVPGHDVAQLAGKLDELDQLLAQAPLLAGDLTANNTSSPAVDPTPVAPNLHAVPNEHPGVQSAESPLPWWEKTWQVSRDGAGQLWHMLSQDLRGLVSIRRIDDADALLMSVEQSTQLRDQLRMRVMMARLALVAPQTGTQAQLWQTEMQQIQALVQARYDLHSSASLHALTLAGQLAQTDIAAQLPPALNSHQAVQALIETMQQQAVQEAAAPETDTPEADAAADESQPAVPTTPANPQERT